MPLVYLVSALGLWLTRSDLPAPLWADPAAIGLSLALFLLAAIAEELGWQAYAWPRMRGPALRSALLLGGIWALWHLVPFVVMGRPASWIVPHLAMAVLMRVVIVWLAVNFGPGLLLAVVLHCLSNAAWGLIDNFDAYYAPGIAMLALLIVVLAVLVRDGPSLRRA